MAYIKKKSSLDTKKHCKQNTPIIGKENVLLKSDRRQKSSAFQDQKSKESKRTPLEDITEKTNTAVLEFDKNISNKLPIIYEDPSESKKCSPNIVVMSKNYMKNITVEREHLDNSFCDFNTLPDEKRTGQDLVKSTPIHRKRVNYKSIKETRKQKFLSDIFRIESENSSRVKGRIKYDENFRITPGIVNLDLKENFVPQNTLYSFPYFDSIVEHLIAKGRLYELSENFVDKINHCNRAFAINCIIKLQAYMRVEHAVVYNAVKIMDRALDRMDRMDDLNLVALASFWISLKCYAVDHKRASWLIKQLGGGQSTSQLVATERLVLLLNRFEPTACDLSTLVHHRMLQRGVPDTDVVGQCSHYALDCATLDARLSRVPPAEIAAAAVDAVLVLTSRCAARELNALERALVDALRRVNNPTFPFREPYYKYSSTRYCNAAHVVLDALLS